MTLITTTSARQALPVATTAASQLTLDSLGCAEVSPASQAEGVPAAFIQLIDCTPLLCTLAGPVVHPEPEAVPDRAILTPEQAIDIFKIKSIKTPRTTSQLATKYGISPKAIRDIWTRKSWAGLTGTSSKKKEKQ